MTIDIRSEDELDTTEESEICRISPNGEIIISMKSTQLNDIYEYSNDIDSIIAKLCLEIVELRGKLSVKET